MVGMKRIVVIAMMVLGGLQVEAQQVLDVGTFFVDGFHGGVYGHYPLATYTQFMADQLEQHPDWYIGLEIEPETWDSVLVRTPQAYQRFKKLITGPQVEVTNPSYAQSYLYNISGESIIRQFQYGMRKLRHHFPGITFNTYSCEEPCFTSQLPQLLTLLGFKYASLKCPNTCWGGYSGAYGGQLVNWVGPDGTSLLTVPRYGCEELQEGSVWQTTAWSNNDPFLNACREAGISNPVGMCYQDAGWTFGPWLRKNKGNTRYVRWTDYIEKHTPGRTDDDWHMSQEDLHPALMWGSQVLQRIGRQVREAESRLVQVEKLAAIKGQPLPQAAHDEAWRTLLLAQHHDSWIVPYNGLKNYGTWADAIRQWTDHTLAFVRQQGGSANDPQGGGAHNPQGGSAHNSQGGSAHALRSVVYNTTGHERHEVIMVDGQPVEISVPAFGYAPLPSPSTLNPPPSTFHPTPSILENDRYRITFDLEHGGIISSLVDKSNGSELVDSLSERRFLELRGHFPQHGGFRSSTEQQATMTWLMDSPLRQQVRIDGEVAGVPFSQTITLTRGQQRIDCQLHIDWTKNMPIGEGQRQGNGQWKHDGQRQRQRRNARRTSFYDTRYMLRLFFPTTLDAPQLSKDAPFDVCESRQDQSYFNRWDSIRHNIMLSWVDLSEGSKPMDRGLALLSDHTTSYTYAYNTDASGRYVCTEPLSLTVQYSGPGLWWRNYPINGATDISYALVPHQGRWHDARLPRIVEDWQNPLVVSAPPATEGDTQQPFSLLECDCQVSAALLDEVGLLTVRLFNDSPDDRTVTLRLNRTVSEILDTDLDGHIIDMHSIDADGVLKLRMSRFGLKNLIIK